MQLNGVTQCSGDDSSPSGVSRNRCTFKSVTIKPETYVIPTAASAEWRNPPRWKKNHHKIKFATWEDPSTRCAPSGWHVDMWCRSSAQVIIAMLRGGALGSLSGSPQKGLQGPGFEKWQALSREDRNRVLSDDSEWYPTTTSTTTSTSATTSTSN